MKFECEVVRFNVADIITASGCTDMRPAQLGGHVEAPCPTKI